MGQDAHIAAMARVLVRARREIRKTRRELLDSHCCKDHRGRPRRDTLDDYVVPEIERMDRLIRAIDRVLA
jgi:hypothetical protein